MTSQDLPQPVTFAQALAYWLKLGFISFGGPAGQIAMMHAELVERRRWISEQRFLHALNYCMLLPGPEATQLAVYIGWLMHRTAGGIAGRRAVRAAVAGHPDPAVLDLPGLWLAAGRGRRAVWHQAGRGRHRAARRPGGWAAAR